MNIYVVTGIGYGKTELSAFDSALNNAGVLNYNLIPLSSVIPPHSNIIRQEKFITPDSEFGYKLYVVRAEIRSNAEGKYLAAGVGWYQFGDDKRGVFVEHEIISDSQKSAEEMITSLIKNSLKDLCNNRNIEYKEENVGLSISIGKVEHQPTSVLVLAVYKSQGWLE